MPRGRKKKTPDDEIFGGVPDPDDADEVPALSFGDQPEDPPPELLALGAPPEDTMGARKWQHRMYMVLIGLTLKDPKISNEKRTKRLIELNTAAAKIQDDAARYDLDRKIAADAEELAGKKRARAAAKMERRPPAGGAKVIPLRPDA